MLCIHYSLCPYTLSYTIDFITSARCINNVCTHMECKVNVERIILILWGLLKCFSDVNCDFRFFFAYAFSFKYGMIIMRNLIVLWRTSSLYLP